tara:strand:+ start:2753 stop:2887 length:135 start_codon:yes stop_codon:yes gene_type:complete
MDEKSLEEKIENTEKEIRELNELLDAHNNEVLKIFEKYLESLNN